jgi:virginiamycin B lyase
VPGALSSAAAAVVLLACAEIAAALPIRSFPFQRHGDCAPESLTMGPEADLWFTEYRCKMIGRMTQSGRVTLFTRGISGETGGDIAVGPDGNMWFTEAYAERIGRITPTGKVSEFPLGSGGNFEHTPSGIIAGPDGNLWFTENSGTIGHITHVIGRITPQGAVSEFAPAHPPGPIAIGPNGNLWFGQGDVGSIGQITPSGVISQIPIGRSGTGGIDVIAAPNHTLWFVELEHQVGLANATGGITYFAGVVLEQTWTLTTTPDGSLWVASPEGGELERVSPAGALTHLGMCTGHESSGHPENGPSSPTSDSNGNLWFTANRDRFSGYEIDRLDVPAMMASLQRDPQQLTLCDTTTAKAVYARIACSGLGAQPCEGTATLTTTERMRHGHSIAIPATTRARAKRVVLGSTHYRADPGGTRRIQIAINATGRSLVRKFKRLPITLTVTALEPNGAKTSVTRRLVVKSASG